MGPDSAFAKSRPAVITLLRTVGGTVRPSISAKNSLNSDDWRSQTSEEKRGDGDERAGQEERFGIGIGAQADSGSTGQWDQRLGKASEGKRVPYVGGYRLGIRMIVCLLASGDAAAWIITMLPMIMHDQWPPTLAAFELESLAKSATTYALSHGLVYLPPATSQPSIPTSAVHAPLALLPTAFPRRLFGQARELQRVYNVLYARIAMDEDFIDRVMGDVQGVGKVDEFVGQLWRGWKQLRAEGLKQPLQLGLFRSDYMLHAPTSSGPVCLKQVEFNTISSSFGPLSERVAAMHRHLYASTGFFGHDPDLSERSFPPNCTTANLAAGLAEAHKAYGSPRACVLFVVQKDERNLFDQYHLELELLQTHLIHVIRQTLDELAHSAIVEPDDGALYVELQAGLAAKEVSTVYFRAGYTPNDYPTPTHYATRMLLERSRAIQCPSIALQLAGGKKIQQVLTRAGVLERFLCEPAWPGREMFDVGVCKAIRDTWMEMWGLDEEELGVDGVLRARKRATRLVLKPQREGGGNNVYKEAIPEFLDSLPPQERQAWIAMELITPPEGAQSYLLRAGELVKTEVVSEIGIFGWALFGKQDGGVKEGEAGWLIRTKGKESNEGGVAAGFSVIDSLLLVD